MFDCWYKNRWLPTWNHSWLKHSDAEGLFLWRWNKATLSTAAHKNFNYMKVSRAYSGSGCRTQCRKSCASTLLLVISGVSQYSMPSATFISVARSFSPKKGQWHVKLPRKKSNIKENFHSTTIFRLYSHTKLQHTEKIVRKTNTNICSLNFFNALTISK